MPTAEPNRRDRRVAQLNFGIRSQQVSRDRNEMGLQYIKAEPKRLRDLGFDERWLQDRISDDPSLLSLGELAVITREYAQPSGGRIDFLMYDPEEGTRYEIEVMLGRLDESHIIRTIEYWDMERRRFPALQHRAVIVAEEITNRFFNVVSLLNQAIPIIAIQLSAFEIGGKVVLHCTKVLDLPEPATDDEGATAEKVDRSHWERRTNPTSMRLVDRLVGLIPTEHGIARVTYNKHHIAIGTSGQNFVWLHPRKAAAHVHMHLLLEGQERTDLLARLEASGIFSGPRGRYIKMRLSEQELGLHEPLIRELLALCEAQAQP